MNTDARNLADWLLWHWADIDRAGVYDRDPAKRAAERIVDAHKAHEEHLARRPADGWYALHLCPECQREAGIEIARALYAALLVPGATALNEATARAKDLLAAIGRDSHRRRRPQMKEKFLRWWRRTRLYAWWLCRTKQCSYYQHYLAYGGPDLTHEGFHAAEEKCDYWQRKDWEWTQNHPDALHSPYERTCERWEKAVRA